MSSAKIGTFATLIKMPRSKLLDMCEFHDIAVLSHTEFKNIHEQKKFLVAKLLWVKSFEEIPLKDVTGKWRVTWC